MTESNNYPNTHDQISDNQLEDIAGGKEFAKGPADSFDHEVGDEGAGTKGSFFFKKKKKYHHHHY